MIPPSPSHAVSPTQQASKLAPCRYESFNPTQACTSDILGTSCRCICHMNLFGPCLCYIAFTLLYFTEGGRDRYVVVYAVKFGLCYVMPCYVKILYYTIPCCDIYFIIVSCYTISYVNGCQHVMNFTVDHRVPIAGT